MMRWDEKNFDQQTSHDSAKAQKCQNYFNFIYNNARTNKQSSKKK